METQEATRIDEKQCLNYSDSNKISGLIFILSNNTKFIKLQ